MVHLRLTFLSYFSSPVQRPCLISINQSTFLPQFHHTLNVLVLFLLPVRRSCHVFLPVQRPCPIFIDRSTSLPCFHYILCILALFSVPVQRFCLIFIARFTRSKFLSYFHPTSCPIFSTNSTFCLIFTTRLKFFAYFITRSVFLPCFYYPLNVLVLRSTGLRQCQLRYITNKQTVLPSIYRLGQFT